MYAYMRGFAMQNAHMQPGAAHKMLVGTSFCGDIFELTYI